MPRRFTDASLTRSRAYSLAVGVVGAIIVVQMLATVTGAVVAGRQFEQASVDTFEYVGELTAERVSRFAEAARDVSEGTAGELERLGADTNRASLEDSLYQRLSREPVVRAVYVGWPDGEFLVLRSHGDGYLSQSGGAAQRDVLTTRVYDHSFSLLSEEETESDYDPRTRPWYQSGATAIDTRWTQPYLDYFNGDTLVSAARSARDADGVMAVVGADLNLNQLAEVLDSLPYGEGAEAFVLTQQLHVIAAPSAYRREIAQVVEDTGAVARAADLGLGVDPALVAPGTERFGRDLDEIVLDRGFPVQESLPWRLHLRASDQQLSAGLGTLGSVVLWLTGLSLVMVLVTASVLWWVRRPLNKMRERSMTDPLTGLLNRREFHRRGRLVAERAAERGDLLMVTVMDLDDFKHLNDQYGHGLGDQALTAVAAALTSSARKGDLAARLGGDEFAVLHVLRDGDHPLRVAQRVRDAIEHGIHTNVPGAERVGVTAGYTTGGAGAGDLDLLLEHADTALVQGKRERKGRVYASPEAITDTDTDRRRPGEAEARADGPPESLI